MLNLAINFPSAKAVILEEYQEELEEAAELLQHNPGIQLLIEGHTDNSGNSEDNKKLSKARAENVRDTLIERYGVSADRLTAEGYGDSRPLTGNETPEGRGRNRRVVAVLHSIKAAPPEAAKCPALPAGEKDERGCPRPIRVEHETSVRLDMEFETGKADILPEYEHEIAELAELLQKDPAALAELEGHTDNRGDHQKNKELSAKRAQAVADLLVSKYSIDRARLAPEGYGDSRPIADNSTEEGRRKNRRVIAIITKKRD